MLEGISGNEDGIVFGHFPLLAINMYSSVALKDVINFVAFDQFVWQRRFSSIQFCEGEAVRQGKWVIFRVEDFPQQGVVAGNELTKLGKCFYCHLTLVECYNASILPLAVGFHFQLKFSLPKIKFQLIAKLQPVDDFLP